MREPFLQIQGTSFRKLRSSFSMKPFINLKAHVFEDGWLKLASQPQTSKKVLSISCYPRGSMFTDSSRWLHRSGQPLESIKGRDAYLHPSCETWCNVCWRSVQSKGRDGLSVRWLFWFGLAFCRYNETWNPR